MAVYFNLAIDCDQDKTSAEGFARFFNDFVVATDRFGDLKCQSEHTLPTRWWGNGAPSDAGDWHRVCVSPAEMSMRSELLGILDQQNMNHVRNVLYQQLQRGLDLGYQFRSAGFGCEIQDTLGDSDWMEELESMNQTGKLHDFFSGLILNSNLVTGESLRNQLELFAEGYLWWNAPAWGY